MQNNIFSTCLVGWGCRIHRLLLCRGIRHLPHNECPGYNTKQSDGEVPVMQELWGMQSTPSLPSLPGPLWSGAVSPHSVLSMGQIELNCVLIQNWIARNGTVFDTETVLMLKWIVWNRTAYLALNNLQWLIYHKTQTNKQTIFSTYEYDDQIEISIYCLKGIAGIFVKIPNKN